MVGFGIYGWALCKTDMPFAPIILGILLGNEMEVNLRRGMTVSDGDWSILVGDTLAIGRWLVALVGFVLPIIIARRVKKKMEAQ